LENVCNNLKLRYNRGKKFSIIVVAEGAKPKKEDLAVFLKNDNDEINNVSGQGTLVTQTNEKDEFGNVRLGGISHYLAREIERRMGVETRVTVLGHVQRGGTPTAYDRILATRFGVAAVELINENNFGKMVALQGNKIVPIDLSEAVSKQKTVDMDLYEISKIFFG